MSIQDKILQANIKVRRTLYNSRVKQSGNTTQMIRLEIVEDDFGDFTSQRIINHELVEVEISGLDQVPLSRLRTNITTPTAPSTNLFLYDILPLKMHTPFSVNIQKNDVLVQKVQDETEATKAFYLVLQVTEVTGAITIPHLVGLEYNIAPYTQRLPSEAEQIVDSY